MHDTKNNTYNIEIPIVHRLYELYKLFYVYVALFPKRDKYTLGAKCEMYIIENLELSLAASSAPREEKIIIIKQLNMKFDTLKIFIRLAKDLNLFDNKKYIILQKQIQEIGRMIGGWQRSLA